MLAAQELPHSLGLVYESLTEHLGFLRSSDEYKVMALASYGKPRFLDEMRELFYTTGDGGFVAEAPDWTRWADRRVDDGTWGGDHADLACSVQARLEEVLVELATWIHAADRRPGADHGRRHRTELRGELAHLARDALRRGVGAAGGR